tara:strand:- start:3877 stop:6459 length:2583 start_codon:yes stop_codon:yes gene_type:complete
MAVKGKEVELLISGTDQNRPAKGQYYQNMYYKNGALNTRSGLGQVAQYDTTMSMRSDDASTVGYTQHLGSSIMVTDFGHTQIISVMSSSCYTGDHASTGLWTSVYSVNIYDVTTGERWEEIIHRHTSEMKDSVSPPAEWHGIYETTRDESYGNWVRASYGQFFFEEAFDVMFFGSKDVGLYCYYPADFNGNRRKQVAGTVDVNSRLPYSESSIITPVAVAPGAYRGAYLYVEKEAFQNPVDAALFLGRLAVARGRTIYFSDLGKPASYIALNNIEVPAEKEITAIESVNDVLVIFTETESFVYQPNVRGTLVNMGRISSMSANIGCVGPGGVSKTEGSLVWVDANGVYSTSGRADVLPISSEIQPFFDSTLSNPLTSYYQNNGETDLRMQQPRSNYSSRNLSSCNVCYCAPKEMTIISVPNMNIALVYQAKRWIVWSVESLVVTPDGAKTEAGVDPKINAPWFLTMGHDIYTVGGLEQHLAIDAVTPAKPAATTSFYILKFGRGGGLDRTVHASEDMRGLAAYYESSGPVDDVAFYLDPLIERADGTYLLPIYLKDKQNTSPYNGPDRISLIFDIDATQWQPVGGVISPIYPSERLATAGGWTTTWASSGLVTLYWDGTTPGHQMGPNMNLSTGIRNLLMFIPVEKVVPTGDKMSLGVAFSSGYTELNLAQVAAGIYYFNTPSVTSLNKDDNVARPVDWVIKSGQVGYGEGVQVKLRTIYSSLKSKGPARESAVDFDWNTGLLNMTISSDWKDYVTQSTDIGGGQKQDANGNTIRNRLNGNAKTFGEPGTATWSGVSDPDHGNILIDEEGLDTISSSNSVKGEHVSVMAFGHVRNRAEGMVVDSMKATIRPVGGRRRKGR